jgi:transposase-like protein
LSCYFAHSPEIRRIMYTTNLIEGVHRQLRKVTKSMFKFLLSENQQLMNLPSKMLYYLAC